MGDATREHWEYGTLALHLRRACTAAEIAALPAGTLERRAALGLDADGAPPAPTGLILPPALPGGR